MSEAKMGVTGGSVAAGEEGIDRPVADETTVRADLRFLLTQVHSPDAQARASAVAVLEAMRAHDAPNPIVLSGLGVARALAGRVEEAQALFEESLAIDANFAPALTNLANLYKLTGRPEEARETYRRALALQPALAEAHYGLAVISEEAGEREEAERHLRRALLFRPDYAEALSNLGHLLLKAGKVDQAISQFRQALALQPGLRPARLNLIHALYRSGHNTEAQGEVDKLLAENPRDLDALRAQATGLIQQGRLQDAEVATRQLAELDPQDADILLDRGELLLARQDYQGALALYKELLARRGLSPVIGLGAMANVLLAQGNHSAARDLYQQALLLDARPPALTLGLARALLGSGDVAQALGCLRHALSRQPQQAALHSMLITTLRLAGETDEAAAELERWRARFGADLRSPPVPREPIPPLRVGFLFGEMAHDGSLLVLAEVLARCDGQRVQTWGYWVAGQVGEEGVRLQEAMHHWRLATGIDDEALAEMIRADALDIVVDTLGHGPGGRLPVLCQRPAPLQIGWLGDSADPRLSQIDGRLTDACLLAGAAGKVSAVGTALLPALQPWRAPAEDVDLPESTPAGRLVVLSPAALASDDCLDAWAEILLAVPAARLVWLSDSAAQDAASRDRLRRLLALREIDAGRVEILPRLPATERRMLIAHSSLVLDSFPQSIGIAAYECLWLGTPVLNLAGDVDWQRSGCCLLAAAGAGDEVCATRADYVGRASALATQTLDRQRRLARRQRLLASPACDAAGYAEALMRALEQCTQQCYSRHCARTER